MTHVTLSIKSPSGEVHLQVISSGPRSNIVIGKEERHALLDYFVFSPPQRNSSGEDNPEAVASVGIVPAVPRSDGNGDGVISDGAGRLGEGERGEGELFPRLDIREDRAKMKDEVCKWLNVLARTW